MYTVGCEQKCIVALDWEYFIIDFEMWLDAHGSVEVVFVVGNPDTMITRQLLDIVSLKTVYSRIANVEKMTRIGF